MSNTKRAPDGYDICPECGHHTSATVGGVCTRIMPEAIGVRTRWECGCDCYRAIHGESLREVIARELHKP